MREGRGSPAGAGLVLPLKAPVGGKQRLAGVLPDAERRLVALSLQGRCLRCAMAAWPPDRVAVVGAGEEVRALAARHGVRVRLEDAGAGQSAAVAIGARWVADQGLGRLATVAGDLPEVEPGDLAWLRDLAEGLPGPGVVAIPDRAGSGTNALVICPPAADVLAFGPDSLARHRRRAAELDLSFRVERRPGLARDCDRPEDLALLLAGWGRGGGGARSAGRPPGSAGR